MARLPADHWLARSRVFGSLHKLFVYWSPLPNKTRVPADFYPSEVEPQPLGQLEIGTFHVDAGLGRGGK
jgi:hypothetical protein